MRLASRPAALIPLLGLFRLSATFCLDLVLGPFSRPSSASSGSPLPGRPDGIASHSLTPVSSTRTRAYCSGSRLMLARITSRESNVATHLDESLFREMYTSARQPCAYLEICLAHQCHTRPWRSTADHRRRNAHTAPVSPYSERPMFTHQPRQRQPIPKSSHGSLEVRGVNVRLEPLVAHGGVQVSKISSAPRRALAALTSISSVWRSAQFLLPHPIS